MLPTKFSYLRFLSLSLFLGILPFLPLPALFQKLKAKETGHLITKDHEPASDSLPFVLDITTQSFFTTQQQSDESSLPFGRQEVKDDTLDEGVRLTKQTGKLGRMTQTFRVTFWRGMEVGEELVKKEIQPPVSEIIQVGTRPVIKNVATADGTVNYSRSLRLFATSYDGHCAGCRGLTFTGKLVTKGICATDPRVIPLGSKLYVEGYGFCEAADIGGDIKDNRIDVGFSDVSLGGWSAHLARVYLLVR